jgi:glycosyltransferase involved in cell wall biosynthesis
VAITVANPQEPTAQAGQLPLCGGRRLKGILQKSTPEFPLVTVVTAVFNGQKDLVKCLDSVLRQDYPNIEHIVLDGGSSDGTIDVLREYDDRIAFWKSEPDKGVYDAWNKSLTEACGEWICFLGADDEFLPGAVSAYMALAARNPDAEFLSSRMTWIHPSGYERRYGEPWSWRRLSRYMCMAHIGSMHRKRLFERNGQFDTSYRIAADYEFLLRAGAGLRSAFMPTVTAVMRGGGISDSGAALHEANRAKHETGGRSKVRVLLDLHAGLITYRIRSFAYGIMGGLKK